MSSSSLERCFTILEILADHRLGLSLGETASRAQIPKSAAHRLLNSLCSTGYVVQLPSRDYRLTLKMPVLGFRFLSNTGILDECQHVLDRLAGEIGDLVRLSMVNDDTLVWVAKAQGAKSSLVIDPVMGHEVALHATATGKVWLASLSTEQALRYVLRDGFGTPQQHGPNVIQTIENLQAELAKTKERGYGLALEEADPGIVAIAVGIPSAKSDDTIVATVSIAGPTSRLSEEVLVRHLPKLRAAADQLRGIDVLMEFADAAL
ncbi:DNA-binding IclR family transcriptional regulator [Rhodobium orientis]|nr:IclR family transcriptional regulator [Rhodobium orientis]MBB4304579.1 DNA-binding IclR family transcriptional regulator [Rhodobium orientis]